jgi:hypothetical protein
MPPQQVELVGRQALDGRRVRGDDLDPRVASRAGQQRNREEQSLAIGREALRLDDRPGPARRADIEIGDMLVPLRDLGQERA